MKTKKPKFATFGLALLLLAALAVGVTIYAHPPTTIGQEILVEGNPTCTAASAGHLPQEVLDLITEMKIDPPPALGFTGVYCLDANGDTILTSDPDADCAPSPRMYVDHYEHSELGHLMDWWGVNPSWTIVSVFVKGGNGGYLYVYNPGIPGSPLGDPARNPDDAGLHALIAGGSGKYADLSHVNFCGVRNDTEEDGCTLGYWGATRQGAKAGQVVHQAAWDATKYTTSTTLAQAGFTCAPRPNDTLLQALRYKGGSTLNDKKNLLIKQAVAALLNADHPDVDYPLTETEILNLVNPLLCSGTVEQILSAQNELNAFNNLGCPLN